MKRANIILYSIVYNFSGEWRREISFGDKDPDSHCSS